MAFEGFLKRNLRWNSRYLGQCGSHLVLIVDSSDYDSQAALHVPRRLCVFNYFAGVVFPIMIHKELPWIWYTHIHVYGILKSVEISRSENVMQGQVGLRYVFLQNFSICLRHKASWSFFEFIVRILGSNYAVKRELRAISCQPFNAAWAHPTAISLRFRHIKVYI